MIVEKVHLETVNIILNRSSQELKKNNIINCWETIKEAQKL